MPWWDILAGTVSAVLILTSLLNSYRIKQHLEFIEALVLEEREARRLERVGPPAAGNHHDG